ncbi:hypothetical protein KMZ93_06510 [Bradyrhizobium sediminis]|uniref:Uncharacterized protein n=1 Tax=Bradyrhizobium sediminis TaxID=2840469 RepID=A0A975P007_9BRAD|nr:hypothetical protein [Bradyrhizobium sediminis]QWG24548.1 hypothetical protein KMZ93_06510 [Bradyrhizobium sediminis]
MDYLHVVGRAMTSLVAGLALAGCGHMPVTSMVKLARVDFVATDPAGLRAAVKLPTAIRPLRDQVRLRLTVRLASGTEDTQDFRLSEVSDPADISSLRHEIEGDTHLFAYRLDPAEAARLAALRDALKKQQTASGGRGGALTISIATGACRGGELPAGTVLLTTYLRTAETGDYVPLARDVDMRSVVRGRDLVAEMPVCGQAG